MSTAPAHATTRTGTARKIRAVGTNNAGAKRKNGRRGSRGTLLASLSVLVAFVAMSLLFVFVPDKPETVLALGMGLTVLLAIVRFPVVGTYTCVVLGILFDSLPSPWIHTFLSDMGVFRNLSSRGLPDAVLVSMFEVVVVVTLVSTLARRFHEHRKMERGALFFPVMAYGAVVLFGEINGIMSGGDFKVSLWELRPLMYVVAIYILAVNTISRPSHISALLWITVLSIAARGLEGVSRFFLMTPDVRSIASVVLEHDDSLFLAAALALVLPAVIWRRKLQRAFVVLLIAMAPLLLYVTIINHRRAAYFCLMLTLATMVPLVWTSLESKQARLRLAKVLAGVLVVVALYIAAFWNSYGALGEPAQAVRSAFAPSERDYLSNLYRIQEDTNLRFTISLSPAVGIGFGKPMEVVVKMVDLTNVWSLQLYMPHNNILWLWMRMGLLGFALFWMLVGASLFMVAGSVRVGLDRMRMLVARQEASRPPQAPTKQVRGLTGEGAGLRVVRLRKAEEPSIGTMGAGRAAEEQRREMRECAEFLLLAFLAQAVLVSMMSLAVLDQGLMSPRISTFWGGVMGALAAAWELYRVKYRQPVVEAPVPEAVPGAYKEIAGAKRNRMRVITGPQSI